MRGFLKGQVGNSEGGRSIRGDRQEFTSAHISEAMGTVVVEVIGVSRSEHKNFSRVPLEAALSDEVTSRMRAGEADKGGNEMKTELWIGGVILAAVIGVSPMTISAQTTEPATSARSADCADVTVAAGAPPTNWVIDVSKMNPTGLLVDRYSCMAQPYSFYYFHHMDHLAFRTDWVRRGSDTYPLKDPTAQFSLRYAFRGGKACPACSVARPGEV